MNNQFGQGEYPQPAILGGAAAITLNQQAANRWPVLTETDEHAVLQVLRDGDISTHPVIRALEDDYRCYTGMPYALAHNNGTTALMAAFWAIGLQPGDEVLVPSATFWASVLPLVWLGAVPVFCESEKDRLGLDPADMARKITPRTKAVVVVHLWGLPSKMTEILALTKQHGLKIMRMPHTPRARNGAASLAAPSAMWAYSACKAASWRRLAKAACCCAATMGIGSVRCALATSRGL